MLFCFFFSEVLAVMLKNMKASKNKFFCEEASKTLGMEKHTTVSYI